MNLHKTYPEAHDAWLYAMGIDVRWRHRAAHDVAQTEMVDVKSCDVALPEVIAQARYWLIGEPILTTRDAYVLAGLLWSINADERQVVYSSIIGQAESHAAQTFATSLPSWSQLRMQDVSSQMLRLLPDILRKYPNLRVFILGDFDVFDREACSGLNCIWLPSAEQMHLNTLQKQMAWQSVKDFRFS